MKGSIFPRNPFGRFMFSLLSIFLIANLLISTVSAVVFTNSAPINTNLAGTAQPATPYPSTINVSGLTGTVTNVSVTITGINHTFPDDLDVVLVGPGGQSLILMSDAVGSNDFVNTDLTFEDSAATQIPDSAVAATGSYRPGNHGGTVVDEFPTPAPATPGNPGPSGSGTATLASVFNTTNPNGTWSLFIVDDAAGDTGFIAGGWSIRVTTSGSAATTFTNSARIRLNDLRGVSTPSTINVSGLTGTISNITVTLNNITHPNVDDLDIILVGPAGQKMIIMSDAGGTTDITGVTLTLSDAAAAALPDSTVLSTGSYRPANYDATDTFPDPVPDGPYESAAPIGTATLNGVFGGTNPNGTWTLYVVDDASGTASQGNIGGGWSLDITTGPAMTPADAPVDMNGDGRTDFVVVRNTGGGSGGQVTWFVQLNGGAANAHPWGISTDNFVPEDYDGDDKDDIAVWRSHPTAANFYVFRSSNSTLLSAQFGRAGDNPTVVDDYDGDNRADFAVYRPGSNTTPSAPCGNASAWFYRPSGTAGVDFRTVCWGQQGDFPAPGDYDGDSRADFVVQRGVGGQGTFFMNKSGGGTETIQWGTPSDVIVPGDYDADGKTDIAVVRNVSGVINWFILERDGGTQTYQFGTSATDFPAQGDYNGDGRVDPGVWRPGTPGVFYARPAGTTGAADIAFSWGNTGDYPVANFNAH